MLSMAPSLVGKTFGVWTVVQLSQKTNSHKERFWRAKCRNCGHVREARACDLRDPSYKNTCARCRHKRLREAVSPCSWCQKETRAGRRHLLPSKRVECNACRHMGGRFGREFDERPKRVLQRVPSAAVPDRSVWAQDQMAHEVIRDAANQERWGAEVFTTANTADLTGDLYQKSLRVMRANGRQDDGQFTWDCRCELCGTAVILTTYQLRQKCVDCEVCHGTGDSAPARLSEPKPEQGGQ